MTELRDELGELLIEKGFAPNDFVLGLNQSLTVPYEMDLPAPWNLPSRLFRFPIEVSAPTKDRPRRIGLMHPLLADHPFVRLVAAALPIALDPGGAPNEHGYSKCRTGLWWHAVDLISEGQWRALLDTAEFTTPGDIFNAVAYGLRYSGYDDERKRNGHISTAEARTIMAELGATEPDQRATLLHELSPPMSCNPDGRGEHWPINGRASSAEDHAWSFILGIEDGWFEYDRSGHLVWSKYGRDRHAAGDAKTYVESGTGQIALAF